MRSPKTSRNHYQIYDRRRKYLIRDERKASREYHAAGLHDLGRDEARHARVLRNLRRR